MKKLSRLIAILLALVFFLSAIRIYRSVPTPQELPVELIIFLISVGIFSTLISFFDISELSSPWFSLKTKQEIKTIQSRQILNRVIKTEDEKFYWVDEVGKHHEIEDKYTALFLSQFDGIIGVPKDYEINKFGTKLPQFLKTADPRMNPPDLFIVFNEKIYYQTGWLFAYMLAVDKYKIEIKDKEKMDKWKEKLKPLTNEDLKYFKLLPEIPAQ